VCEWVCKGAVVTTAAITAGRDIAGGGSGRPLVRASSHHSLLLYIVFVGPDVGRRGREAQGSLDHPVGSLTHVYTTRTATALWIGAAVAIITTININVRVWMRGQLQSPPKSMMARLEIFVRYGLFELAGWVVVVIVVTCM